jgi:hypothetical protein
MKVNSQFKIINVLDETLAVPTGEKAESFHAVVSLTPEAAFVLSNINGERSEDDLLRMVLEEYDVDENTAKKDIKKILHQFQDIGITEE